VLGQRLVLPGETGRAGVEVAQQDVNELLLQRDSAILAALASDVDDGAVVGDPDVADIRAQQLVGPQTSRSSRTVAARTAFSRAVKPPRRKLALRLGLFRRWGDRNPVVVREQARMASVSACVRRWTGRRCCVVPPDSR
jgi:hypothetical protein